MPELTYDGLKLAVQKVKKEHIYDSSGKSVFVVYTIKAIAREPKEEPKKE